MYTEDMPKSVDDKSKPLDTKYNWTIVAILIVIVLIVAYFLLFKDLFKNKNTKMEEEMVEKAKDYVLRNNVSTTKEIYLDVTKLNVTLNDNCSLTSGVIYDGTMYYPNLVCNDYKSNIIKTNSDLEEFIKIKGDDVVVLPKGVIFFDQGYESKDLVTVIGNVGSEEGVYNIYYKTTNSTGVATRKVIIIDNQIIRNLFPTLTLNGDEVIYLVEGNNYVEQGINGYDTIDGNISNKVVIDGVVNYNVVGEYNISYTLTNSRGYSNTITRKVNVISHDSDLVVDYTLNPRNLTNENVLITLNVSSDYNKIIYPDNTSGDKLTYEVIENGNYKFIIYDKYDRIIEKEIVIDNIDKTVPQGSCVATRYYNRTEIKVTIDTEREISSYEYLVNTSTKTSQSNYYVAEVVKPSTVKVKVIDIVGNNNEIKCSFEDKLTRNIVTDSKGKNCLEGFKCYIQFDYGDARHYPYCSMSNNPNSCGGIGRNGCSITSTSNAIAAMGVKSKTGVLHTPYTVWDELYPVNHKNGQCGGGCSAWSRMRDAVINAGLSAPQKVGRINNNTIPEILDHLRKGYPVIVWADTGAFTSGKHYMALLGVREDNYVFLSDSANTSGITKKYFKGKQYYVDTWIPTDDLITGLVKEYLLVGPYGLFEGK
jgi:hypothetical protein